MAFLQVLGLINGIMGFWSFGDNMFPQQKDMYSNYKVFVGIDGTGNPSDPGECCLQDAGGSISYSKVFNSYGLEIGRGGQFPKLKSGSDETITMWQNIPQQAITVELFAGKDAICIAAIGATLHDGTHWGWVGDWGKICGLDWYYSGVKQPQWNNDSPLCTWIDADHSGGLKAGGIAINWHGFTNTVLPVDGGEGRCGTRFEAWDKEGGKSVINKKAGKQSNQTSDGGDTPTRRRRLLNHDRRLVVSSLPAHSADELCRHPMSRGPSFVSLTEGTYCNMETREVLPLCADGLTTGCFDLEAETAVDRISSFGGRGGGDSPDASHVIYWDNAGDFHDMFGRNVQPLRRLIPRFRGGIGLPLRFRSYCSGLGPVMMSKPSASDLFIPHALNVADPAIDMPITASVDYPLSDSWLYCEDVLQSHGLGAQPRRVTSSLGRRGLSSASKDEEARVIKLFKEAKSAYLGSSNVIGGKAPKPRTQARRPRRESEVLASTQPHHVGGPRLSPEQAEVVELAASGRDIFYTGSAGCGKSTVLRAMVQRLTEMGKRVRVVAPTGRAALAINGTTTWTFAGWSPNSHKDGIEKLRETAKRKNSMVRRRFRRTDVIIIDEISMVENLHFERLNQVMKAARHKPSYPAQQYPFGGVQVIVTGDFSQLPPVKPFKHCMECGSEMQLDEDYEEDQTYHCGRCSAMYHEGDKWAFRSKAWEECDFAYVYLDTIHRQRDADFISLLDKCRLGYAFTPEEIDLLMNHETSTTGAVELYSTREEVRLVNERGFQKLATRAYSFRCRDTFIWNREKHPHLEERGKRHTDGSLKSLDEHSMDRLVELKCGMPVVLLVNLDLDKGLCNGSQGVVVGWTSPDRAETWLSPSSGDHEDLKCIEMLAYERTVDEPVWPVVRFSNGIERAIRAECQVNELGDDEPYSLLCRTQIPLTAAWAMSIHRAQGMTLEKVKVDVSKAFADGQVYVALSRATSLRGLEVVGNARGLAVGVGGNKEVRLFYKHNFGL